MKESRPCRIIVTLLVFLLSAFLFTCSPKKSSSDIDYINDVFVQDKYVAFDNDFHGLDVVGLRDGDTVLYSDSADGEYTLAERVYKDVGSYTVYFKISRPDCHDLMLSATLYIYNDVLDGISSSDSTVVYDGKTHSITIDGVEDGDGITYSLDGETFYPALALTEVGEYKIFYIVTRDYAEYRSSATLTILPNASGTYLNSVLGVLIIDGLSASDGLTLSYDLSRTGYLGDKTFSFTDDYITVDGIRYNRIADDADVYTLSVNGSIAMYFTDESVDVDVAISDSGAVVTIGQTVLSFPGYNYCESINSAVNTGISCGMTLRSNAADIAVVLSSRPKQAFENLFARCIYDGLSHAVPGENLLYEVDGEYTSTPPVFTEVGTYTVNVVSVKAGYLPARGTSTLVIIPSPDGVYYSVADNVFIRIENAVAVKNGSVVSLEYTDDCWLVDGIELSFYTARSDEPVFVIYVDNKVEKIITTAVEYLCIHGNVAYILTESRDCVSTFTLPAPFVRATLNGTLLVPITPSEYDLCFGIGASDQTGDVCEVKITCTDNQ